MAASILLSPLVQVILDNLNSLIKEEISAISGVEKDLRKLSTTLSIINGVLEDAEEKQSKERSVKNWLMELKDAAYEADDILDEWATEVLRRKVDRLESNNSQVSKYFSPCFCLNKVVFRRKIGQKIKEIRERLQEIETKRYGYDLKVSAPEMPMDNRETCSLVDESTVLGREDDKEKIVELLLSDECSRENGSVIPIVGIGGLGKTTLAQFVYNDERIKNHFELQMWVCVSENFDVKGLIRRIVESATEKMSESLDLDLLQRRLREALGVKRYLLVLDDVWNEDREKWESLRNLLRGDGRGSKIIVTTRSEKVASIMGATPIHLKGLSEDDSWLLFKQRAFGERNEQVHPNLVAIGGEIVKKSKGVPLAVKVLGGLLHVKRSESEWLSIKDSEIWDLPDDENGILNALRLSYDHLPSHLKQCFAYCSIFPRDYAIQKKELIRLWMAQSLIQPSKGDKEMEDIGSEYFDHLLWRSFFQDIAKDEYGDITSCKMHDLIHDLAQYIANNECCIIETSKSRILPKKALHLALFYDGMGSSIIPDALYQSKNLRTLLMWITNRDCSVEVPSSAFLHLNYLRVLDLGGCQIKSLPDSICKLKHLRYLNLSCTKIESLPKSICSLRNLQTLNIRNCNHFYRLPSDMRNMINLRHLDVDNFCLLDRMPAGIGKLTCLQTLPIFIVGNESGCGISELQDLNLRGELTIKNLENVMSMGEAIGAKLKSKQHLHSLNFNWSGNMIVNAEWKEVQKEVLEGLQPHTKLKRLSITNYSGDTLPSWLIDLSLCNLVKISLVDCRNCENLPLFGKLSFLKELSVSGMDRVKYVSNESCGEEDALGFPALEELTLERMCNLENWSRVGSGNIRCLRKLKIFVCPKLRSLPMLPSLDRLELYVCDVGMLRILPHLTTLSSLRLGEFTYVTPSLGEGLRHLAALRELEIESCNEMGTILEHLPATLEKLTISNCPNLMSLPKELPQNLSGLRILVISHCPKLTSLTEELQNLTTLQSLCISGCPMLTLPETVHHLTALESLTLDEFPNMTCLPEPLQHLTGLQYLGIINWPELSSLPEWIGDLSTLQILQIEDCPKLVSLPEGLQRLTRLDYLEIMNKIQHIPNIHIDL